MTKFKMIVLSVSLVIVLFSGICTAEKYLQQESAIVVFCDTLKKTSPTVYDYFMLFGKQDESELELILRQRYPSLDWKGNWFHNKKASDYVKNVYSKPQNYPSRFLRCIKLSHPDLSSKSNKLKIDRSPKILDDFKEFNVMVGGKKLIFQFSQDDPYIENIYFSNGDSIFDLIEICTKKNHSRINK
ncbi:MAG: hypothetical protein EPN22_10365 [Nitrospirae bacterium]|nr:MAG: hypothetical protein EPN22_10365 [Nitrospirota bacterium]